MKISLTKIEAQSITALAILAIVGIFYIHSVNEDIRSAEMLEQEIEAYQESIKPYLNLALNATSFSIYNADKKEFVYKKNAEQIMPLASLAKVMSAIVVLENTTPLHVFTIEKESIGEIGDNGLLLAEKWPRDAFLRFMLLSSSNDAVHQMALEVGKIIDPASSNAAETFVDALNAKAKEMNLRTMIFNNESGLDVTLPTLTVGTPLPASVRAELNGAYSNARDMTKLFAYAIKTYPDIFSVTSKKTLEISSLDKTHTAINTNPIVEEIDGIIASKTGFTNLSGGNLIVAVPGRNGETMIVVVLGSTFDERFNDIKTLSGAVTGGGAKPQ